MICRDGELPTPSRLHIEPLRSMLAIGRVDTDRVRLWMRVERPGRYVITAWRAHQLPPIGVSSTITVTNHGQDLTATAEIGSLVPDCLYRVEVRDSNGQDVAAGQFRTAPECTGTGFGGSFSIAVMSCYQPFNPKGGLDRRRLPMLRASHAALRQQNTRIVLMAGDQFYADAPARSSLFSDAKFLDKSEDEVRRAYQERYRRFWNVSEWQRIQAEYPCYPVPDDHEVVREWGSLPEHGSPRWQTVRRGALAAYHDYQASRMGAQVGDIDRGFFFGFQYGPVAAFAMDLCTGLGLKTEKNRLGDSQLGALGDALERSREQGQSVFVLTLNLPLYRVPGIVSWIGRRLDPDGYAHVHGHASGNRDADRNRLLALLHDHMLRAPGQRVVIVSGDLHLGAVLELRLGEDGPKLHHLISSPVADRGGVFATLAARLSLRFRRNMVGRAAGETLSSRLLAAQPPMRNPYGGLNLGFIEIDGPWSHPSLRLSLWGEEHGQPRCVFRTDPL